MKKKTLILAHLLVLLIMVSCNNGNNSNNMEKDTTIFGLGEPVPANFTGDAWLQGMSSVEDFDCSVYNVTFAPGTRNYWHSHAVGQILLCTDGTGYYQEQGKPAQRLKPGDVVNIPANVIHWHGASPDSRFTHIGITPRVSDNSAEWHGPVTDEEYTNATK